MRESEKLIKLAVAAEKRGCNKVAEVYIKQAMALEKIGK